MGRVHGETTQAPGGSIIIMLPTKAVVGFLATLAIAEAAKLNEDSLYHVVEDFPANETVEASDENVATCSDIMARNGLNFSSFWHGAAHGLHSLHLEEIRHFFEPNASENNKIPVVNKNFSSKQTILFDAPLAGYDEHFNTMALKVMSYFMLNDHSYHMHEIYAAAAPIYNAMKENPPSDPELCACVNDITGNGILIEMANIAKQLKYFASKRRPRAMAEDFKYNCDKQQFAPQSDGYASCRRKKRDAENTESDEAEIADLEQEYLANPTHEAANSLLHASPWKSNTLVGPEQWISYQAMLTTSMLEEEELNDFATFMYCRLNQPDTDHPKGLFD